MRYAGPDLRALARAFGLRAFTATDEPMLNAALVGARSGLGPALIDARIDPSGYRRMLEIVRGAPK
jgi:thiamine pyrophosphate-dependent acetolactate synthase large subunit-like protein